MTVDEMIAYCFGLVHQMTEKIEMNYLRSVASHNSRPVVLVIKADDPFARYIAERKGQPDLISRLIAQAESSDRVPALLWGISLELAHELLETHFPGEESLLLEEYPEEGYLAIVVAHGGFMSFPMPPVTG